VATLFVLYGLGYWSVVERRAASLGLILCFAAAFCVLLFFAYPATAVDIFQYVAQGRLVAAHAVNPFLVAPLAYPGDAIVPFLAFPREPSQYGPLWAGIEGAIDRLSSADVSRVDERLVVELGLYKLLGAVGQLVGAWLVFVLAGRLGAERPRALGAAYLFAWNPLLLWEMVGNGHNDGLMMLGGLLACLALSSSRYDVLALPALALGALAAWRRRERLGGLALAWVAGTWLPFAALSLFWLRTSYLYYMVIVMPGIYLAVARLFTRPRTSPWSLAAFLLLLAAAAVLSYPFVPLPAFSL